MASTGGKIAMFGVGLAGLWFGYKWFKRKERLASFIVLPTSPAPAVSIMGSSLPGTIQLTAYNVALDPVMKTLNFTWTLVNNGTASITPSATYTVRLDGQVINKTAAYAQLGGSGQGEEGSYAFALPMTGKVAKIEAWANLTIGGGAGGVVFGVQGPSLGSITHPVADLFLTGRGVTVYDK